MSNEADVTITIARYVSSIKGMPDQWRVCWAWNGSGRHNETSALYPEPERPRDLAARSAEILKLEGWRVSIVDESNPAPELSALQNEVAELRAVVRSLASALHERAGSATMRETDLEFFAADLYAAMNSATG